MKKSNFGFTLIELMVSITIIAILSAIGMTSYKTVSKKSRDSRRKADLEQIRGALELYRADEGSYIDALPDCGNPLIGSSTTYIAQIPCDPQNTSQDPKTYQYSLIDDYNYTLMACLETEASSGNCGALTCEEGLNPYCIHNP